MELVAIIATIVGVIFGLIFGGRNLWDFVTTRLERRRIARAAPLELEYVDLDKYFERVQQNHRRLRFGDPTTSAADQHDGSDKGTGISLFDVYMPLSVATEFGGGTNTRTTRPVQLRITVEEALAKPEARRVVILGDPGAGKSTLVDHLVADRAGACRAGPDTGLHTEGAGFVGPPVHVRLSELVQHEHGIWGAVFETHTDGAPSQVLCEELEALLDMGGLIVFDGLDEVPAEHVAGAIRSIVATSLAFPQAQILVTCRPYDYYLATPNRQLPSSFTKLRLLPFSMDDMLGYVDRWCSALSELKFVSNPLERKRNLQYSLRNSSALESLGGTPLLLALMALVHTTEGELPSARSVLYHRAVNHLLTDNPQWRGDFVTESIRSDEMIAIAQAVAFEIHTRETSSDVAFMGLTIGEIESVVSDSIAVDALSQANYTQIRRSIDARVSRMIHSNGLLVELTAGKYHFSHRSLQEFLAGLYFLHGNDYELATHLAGAPQWHEPFVLMAGYGGRDGYSLFFLTKFIEELSSADAGDSRLERLLLAGEMLAEIGRDTLRSKRYEALVEPPGSTVTPLWWRIVDQLFAAHDGVEACGDNVRILQVLGRLGDPRFVLPSGVSVCITDRIVELQATELVVGDDDPDRPSAKSRLVETAPLRTVKVDGLYVATYPAINSEFADFIDAGGYSESRWWTRDGLRWLSGEEGFAETLADTTTTWIERDFGTELQTGKFRMEDVLRDAADMAKPRTEPFFWRNTRYNQDNQPVVGINWWEASAYCAWLTDALKRQELLEDDQRVHIPNEWQWERLARGVGDLRPFPWGFEADTTTRAHTRFDGLDLDAATPVGSFPLGRTADGLLDVAGNVWEWTSSQALPTASKYDGERHCVEGVVDVVVRGGSWFSDVNGAVRCGYRGIDLPQNVYYDVGFRIVISRDPQKSA